MTIYCIRFILLRSQEDIEGSFGRDLYVRYSSSQQQHCGKSRLFRRELIKRTSVEYTDSGLSNQNGHTTLLNGSKIN